MSRVTEIDGNEVTVTADSGVLHPGRLYFVEGEARLEEGDAVSACLHPAVMA